VYRLKEELVASEEIQARRLIYTHLSHDVEVTKRSLELPDHAQFVLTVWNSF
jgi:hypothetical protein